MKSITPQQGFAHLTDLPCICLTLGDARAVVSLFGGQVLSYQPAVGDERLWLSPKASWKNQPIRGGIPVCWPWFGPISRQLNPSNASYPNHGLVRTMLWSVEEQIEAEHFCAITLTVTLDALPQTHLTNIKLTLYVELSATHLMLRLTCDVPLLQQAALHSYFAVSAPAEVVLSDLPNRYIDKVKDSQGCQQVSALAFNQEIDRIYQNPPAKLQLADDKRSLQLNQTGHDATVVWNPWLARCAALSDMLPDSYLQFVCVETARLGLETASPLNLVQRLTSLK